MQYRKLGHTDIDVSVICLGTMTWGQQNTEAEAQEQLEYALDQGVNFIDTAELYAIPPRAETYGLTERYIGNWLKQRGNREDLIIASKVAGRSEAPDGFASHIRGGPRLNKQHIAQAVDDSLARLQTDYIDLYQVHWPERNTNFFGKLGFEEYSPDEHEVDIHETLSALGEAVQQGKIRYIGLSNETPWGLSNYLALAKEYNLPRVVSVQNPYSLLNRTYEVGLAEFAPREQVGLLAYSPLGFGVLSGKYLHGELPKNSRLDLFPSYQRYSNTEAVNATEQYAALAATHNISLTQMALAFINSRSFVNSNIIGATTMQQLKENIASIDVQLEQSCLEAINDIHRSQPNPAP